MPSSPPQETVLGHEIFFSSFLVGSLDPDTKKWGTAPFSVNGAGVQLVGWGSPVKPKILRRLQPSAFSKGFLKDQGGGPTEKMRQLDPPPRVVGMGCPGGPCVQKNSLRIFFSPARLCQVWWDRGIYGGLQTGEHANTFSSHLSPHVSLFGNGHGCHHHESRMTGSLRPNDVKCHGNFVPPNLADWMSSRSSGGSTIGKDGAVGVLFSMGQSTPKIWKFPHQEGFWEQITRSPKFCPFQGLSVPGFYLMVRRACFFFVF